MLDREEVRKAPPPEFLGLTLAKMGIPSDVEYDNAEDYEPDPWRPKPGEDVVRLTVGAVDAARLSGILEAFVDGRLIDRQGGEEVDADGARCNCGAALIVQPDGHGRLRDVEHLDWCDIGEGEQ